MPLDELSCLGYYGHQKFLKSLKSIETDDIFYALNGYINPGAILIVTLEPKL